MSLTAVKMLGIKVTNSSKKEILEEIQKYLSQPAKNTHQTQKIAVKPLVIVTPNPEQIVLARENSHFRDIINQADIAIPDGIGIVWASRFLPLQPTTYNLQPIKKTIPGIELTDELVSLAAKRGISIALIGGRDKIALKAFECLSVKHPGLRGWALDPGGVSLHDLSDLSNLSERIIKTKVGIVFVGLGAPKQEYFIEKLVDAMSFRPPSRNPEKKRWIPGQARDDRRIVFMSVGGSFDVISGRVKRAPEWMRSIGFEWLWRLTIQPWRIKRQLALLQFIFLVLQERFALN